MIARLIRTRISDTLRFYSPRVRVRTNGLALSREQRESHLPFSHDRRAPLVGLQRLVFNPGFCRGCARQNPFSAGRTRRFLDLEGANLYILRR